MPGKSSTVSVFQSSQFERQFKKLHPKQRGIVEMAIKTIIQNPFSGVPKRGDLSGVFVYKFPIEIQQYLLAYTWDSSARRLLLLGTHENFYRKLKGG